MSHSKERFEKKAFASTVTLRNGTRIEIEERLTVDVIEAEARKVNAVKVQLENGTEIFLN
jgi:putative ubiquitin-RnfH superfamily antitoxin RatB of RatAB toxin-antitoxin module